MRIRGGMVSSAKENLQWEMDRRFAGAVGTRQTRPILSILILILDTHHEQEAQCLTLQTQKTKPSGTSFYSVVCYAWWTSDSDLETMVRDLTELYREIASVSQPAAPGTA